MKIKAKSTTDVAASNPKAKSKQPKTQKAKGWFNKKQPKQKLGKAKRPPKVKSAKNRNKKGKQKRANRKRIVGVPTNKHERLVDKKIMKPHNFLSATTSMLTQIYGMKHLDERSNRYEVAEQPHHVSAILKLVLATMSTNEMDFDWSLALWDITQQDDVLPENCSVTFTRVFERKDNALTRKKISRRKKLSILSSSSESNAKRQSTAAQHDFELMDAIDKGDSVMAFSGEAIVTAPDEQQLEIAVEAVKNYFKANDETRGLRYELDVNKQIRPFITYGPNDSSGNKDVYTDMTSWDAGVSSLFVDSGGDRSLGAEYVGVSVGKLIRSHAAYNFRNHNTLFIGNDTYGKTTTLAGEIDDPSQIYLSKVTSRAYLLAGQQVTHFVLDDAKSVDHLMDFPINDERKVKADVSLGLLNMLEAVDNGELKEHPERILSRFPTHLNNIITLLSQFRDGGKLSLADDFANVTRSILIDFFITNKYWADNARNHLDDIRLVNVYHNQFKTLSDFGQYVVQRKRSNTDADMKAPLAELDTIVNDNILPTIPALNTQTNDIIDALVRSQYRVVDFTGMSVGAVGTASNPPTNTMVISYLNLLLPSMKNGDVLMFHGMSRISSIARVVKDMVNQSGLNIDLVFTESNQNAAVQMMSATADIVEEEDEKTHKLQRTKHAMTFDFVAVDLYKNRTDKLIETFGMNKEWVANLTLNPETYFIKTEKGLDYIHLDRIL